MPNCYECLYRGTIPGDAHSRCDHPSVNQSGNMFEALADLISGKNDHCATDLNIHANQHGVQNGWFFWPVNFDPVWLENCDGFIPKDGNDL